MRLVEDRPATPRYWQVCFIGDQRKFWWDWLLPSGFRHVFLLGYVPEFKVWLCYDVLFFKTEIVVHSGATAGFLLELAHREGACLTWPAPIDPPRPLFRFGMWCVPAVKHILGLRCVAMTPNGLHQYLLRHGAKPLFEDAHEPVQRTEDTGCPEGRSGGDRGAATGAEPSGFFPDPIDPG